MPKILYFIIAGSLVFAALAVFNITNANAREETKFIQFSVLAEEQANYGVDKNAGNIPAISIDIIEDKLHDSGTTSTIPIIKYKYLPSQNPKPVHKDNDGTQAADEPQPHNNHENNGNGSSVNNGNGSSSQNSNGDNSSNPNNNKPKDTKPNKGNGTDKPDGKNTDKGSSGSNTNNNKTTDKGNGNSTNSGDSGSSDSTVDLGGNGKGNSSSQSK